MYWNRTMAVVERKRMPPSSINYTEDSTTIDVVETSNPNRSTQITSTCYTTQTPLPSQNDTLPLGHSSPLTNEPSVPPCYKETTDPNAHPPSYDSIFGRIREANQLENILDFLMYITGLIFDTISCTIIPKVSLAIPISMMVIGGVYYNDCPQISFIPIYLLTSGAAGVMKHFLDWLARMIPEDQEECYLRKQNCRIGLGLFALLVIGSKMVYKEFEPNYNPSLGNYCNKTLYLFAFWQITLSYICLVIMLVYVCCIRCVNNESSRSPPRV